MEPSKPAELPKDETVKYRIVFLPSIEYDVIKGCIPLDNLVEYQPMKDAKIDSFQLLDSRIVFVPELFRSTLQMKANRGESL